PDIAVTIPEICQPLSNRRAAVEPFENCECGRSHTKLTTTRCVRSKSETPRLAPMSSWVPTIPPVSPTGPVFTPPASPPHPPAREALSIDLAKQYETSHCSPWDRRVRLA